MCILYTLSVIVLETIKCSMIYFKRYKQLPYAYQLPLLRVYPIVIDCLNLSLNLYHSVHTYIYND